MTSPDRLRPLRFSDNGFAFDPSTGLTYTFNPTSLRIVAWLLEGCPEEELPKRLAAEYDASPHTTERDTHNFLSAMRGYRLL